MKSTRNNFQPKDARTYTSSYDDEEEDDDMTDLYPPQGRRMMTGTQALVDFLKTTSPEEFQRATPERSVNNLFSRIRKTKRNVSSTSNHQPIIPTPSTSSRSVPSSTMTLPVTLGSTLTSATSYHGSEFIPRKNYIEIVPQQQKLISRSAGNSRSPSFDTTSIQSFVLRNSNTNNNNNNKGSEPILPNKKRESSIYSGSLRHSASVRSQLSTITNSVNRRTTLTRENSSLRKIDVKATEEFMNQRDGMDLIESALIQRLERMKIANEQIPSDKVAAGLATEHIRALGITHILDNQYLQEIDKTKVRHMQVQTEDLMYSHDSKKNGMSDDTPPSTPKPQRQMDEVYTDAPEIRARRAEAALENALDHFEVISGLAYKKLRELWEEKMRWENACMELRDRVLALEQKKYPFQNMNEHGLGTLRGEYFPEENDEEDELGLSEFPCSEK